MNKHGGDAEFISYNIRTVERFKDFLDKHSFDPTENDNVIFIIKDRERAVGTEKYYDTNESTNEKLVFIDVENTGNSNKVDITNFLFGFTMIKKKGDDEFYKFSEDAIDAYENNNYDQALQPDANSAQIEEQNIDGIGSLTISDISDGSGESGSIESIELSRPQLYRSNVVRSLDQDFNNVRMDRGSRHSGRSSNRSSNRSSGRSSRSSNRSERSGMIVTDEHLINLITEISFFITKHINDGGDYQNFNIEDALVANQENIIKNLDYNNQHIFILYLLSCGISPNISYDNEYSILENLVMSSANSNNNIYIIINIIENHDGQIMKLTPYVSNNHDADGVSLLMIANDSMAFNVAKYLIDKGIDSNIRDSNGKTALDYFNMINENNVPEDFQDDYMYVKNKLEENMDQNGGNIISGMMNSVSNQLQQIQDKINMVKNNIETVKNNIETVKQLISNPELINDMVLIFKNNPNNAIKLVKENENYKNIYNIIDKVTMNSTSKNAMIKTLNTIKQIKDSVNNPAIKIILDVNPELNIPLTIIKKHAQILDNIKLLIDKISNIHQNTMTTRGGGKYKKGKSRKQKGKRQKTKKQTKKRKYKKGKSRKRKYKNNYRVK